MGQPTLFLFQSTLWTHGGFRFVMGVPPDHHPFGIFHRKPSSYWVPPWPWKPPPHPKWLPSEVVQRVHPAFSEVVLANADASNLERFLLGQPFTEVAGISDNCSTMGDQWPEMRWNMMKWNPGIFLQYPKSHLSSKVVCCVCSSRRQTLQWQGSEGVRMLAPTTLQLPSLLFRP